MDEKASIKTTSERSVPEDLSTLEEYLLYFKHLFTYEYVQEKINSDQRVLEIGFGEGYGTSLLAKKCKNIVAVEIEEKVVKYANQKHGSDNCRFLLYDGHTLPFENNSFDVIVTFQVIEHIKDDNHFVKEIYRVLNTNGSVYITTPNRAVRLKPGQKPWDRYHIREYYNQELVDLLANYFNNVKIYGINATEEIRQIEFKRIHQGFLLYLALKLGIRKLIPESLDLYVARIFGLLRGRKKITKLNDNILNKYSTSDYWIEEENISESLDLFCRCDKS